MARSTMKKVLRVCPKLTTSQKATRREKFMSLTMDVNDTRDAYLQEVQSLAKKHGRSERWTRRQLFLSGSALRRWCSPNTWNGFIHQRLMDINEDLSKGDHWKLTDFVSAHKETLQHNYSKLTAAQKNGYAVKLIKMRAEKQRVVHNNPKGVHRNTTMSFAAMDQEWTALCSRLGIEGFYIAVRGGIEDLSGPKLFFSEKAEKFVCAVLDLEPRCLALKLEAFVISGLDSSIPSTRRQTHTLNKLISDCRTIIQDELGTL
ncbi:hypothetical protein EDB19DRAFT_1834293 [Suillus lakei]|nr:hypothetical protein EDB19DRAFT_1834293 [Suillus lakei]